MSTIMRGDRVLFLGKSFDVSYGESGIVMSAKETGFFVQFSAKHEVFCYPCEVELLQRWEDYAALSMPGAPKNAPTPKGAKKSDSLKPDLAYIPLVALEAEAGAFAVGGAKYGAFNYLEGGFTTRRLMAALIRHAYKYLQGEEVCPVDGQHHLGSVRATAAMILHLQQEGVLVDDRYVPRAVKVSGE